MTIPVPQRINNKLEDFYPLQKEELMKLREVKLINNAAYVHLALRYENPFCDRPVQIIPKEFALRWRMPESSVYSAIARLKELGILNIKSGKLVIDWVKPEKQQRTCPHVTEEELENIAVVNDNSAQKSDSQIREKIIRSEKKLSDPRIDSQILENQPLEPLSDIASGIPQTLQSIQTNQTRGEEEKTFSQNQEFLSQKVVQKLVQKTEDESRVTTDKQNESVEQTTCDVVQEKTKIISPSKSSAENVTAIPDDLREKLEELEISLDDKVRNAIASHHISQAYGAAAHCENTRNSITNVRSVFLYQLPKQPIEKLGSRYSEELLERVKAQNQAIEKERSDPEYQKRSKDAFAQIRTKLGRKKQA
jgi:hypothetical protein